MSLVINKTLEGKAFEKTVLYADDNNTNFLLLKSIFDDVFHVTLLRAYDGREAIEEFKKFKENILYVIMDVMMPNVDGHQATSTIREIDKNIPIYAHTASENYVDSWKEIGYTGFIPKPLDLQILMMVHNENIRRYEHK